MFCHMEDRTAILLSRIDGFLARSGMGPTRLSLEAVGSPAAVREFFGGRKLRLDTADRLLVWMGEEPFGPAFRAEVEAFVAATGTKISALGDAAVGDPAFVTRLRRGSSPRLDTCDRVSAWIAAQGLAGPGADEPEETGEYGMTEAALRLMKTWEAAKYLGLSPATMNRYRVNGKGPAFYRTKGGSVRYRVEDLDAWLAGCRFYSTAEADAADATEASGRGAG